MNESNVDQVTPDLDRLRKLLVKVKELADRGEDGEKQAAQSKLDKLVKKYGFKLKDFEEEKKGRKVFRVSNKDDSIKIMSQTIWDVVPKIEIKQHTHKYEVYATMTSEQYIEVCEKYKYYWNLWIKDKKQLLTAFIVKNRIGTNGQLSSGGKLDKDTIDGIRTKMDSITEGKYVSKKNKQLS